MESTQAKRNIPRDLFLHLLAIVTLYWASISFVALLYQYINYFFPYANSYYQGFSSGMRFAISSLIIVFPVFLITSWYLNKIYAKEAIVRESKIRKWLIYLTLFVAALVVIGDLVTAINYLLNGDFTIRFALKVLSVLVVAGGIFWYYLDDVKKDAPSQLAKPFAIGSATLVLVAVIASFFIIGSPKTAREIQYDQQRVYHLQGIQSEVIRYWQSKKSLPANLEALRDPLSSFMVTNDPETNESYEYRILSAETLSFELCATFKHPSEMPANTFAKPLEYGGMMDNNWEHGPGRTCFQRTIDPDFYPPITK